MRLMKLAAFRKLIFTPDSAPALATLRAQIDRNALPGGQKIDGHYHVDVDEFDAAFNHGAQRRDERSRLGRELDELARNPLLEGLLGPKKKR